MDIKEAVEIVKERYDYPTQGRMREAIQILLGFAERNIYSSPMTLPSLLEELLPEKRIVETKQYKDANLENFWKGYRAGRNKTIDLIRSNAEKMWGKKIGRVLDRRELLDIVSGNKEIGGYTQEQAELVDKILAAQKEANHES